MVPDTMEAEEVESDASRQMRSEAGEEHSRRHDSREKFVLNLRTATSRKFTR